MNLQRLALLTATTSLALVLAVVVLDRHPADGQEVPAVVRARAIQLVDDRGKARAELKVVGDGAILYLRDRNGTIRTKLGGGVDGSGLLLANERTELGAQLLATRSRTSLTLRRGDRRKVLKP